MEQYQDTRYINTDLCLCSTIDLTPLADAITTENLLCLGVHRSDDGFYNVAFEAFNTSGNYATPEESINALLDAIDTLPASLKSIWQTCEQRTLDIGYNSGTSPNEISNTISTHNLGRMHALRIDMKITVYRALALQE
ncbi:MAG: hypothetical protein NWQ13_06460 [Glaciimonas sp.]|nr:hypothetical protein [Glaciimonas sp.]